MEIEFRLPGPDDPFAPPKPRPEDLGPDDLGNKGVLRVKLEEQGKRLRAEFAELDAARVKAEEEIELERAGVDLTLESVRLAGLPDEEGGAQESDPLRAFADFARERIAVLPEGAREDAALHAGHERLKLDRAWRRRRHNTRVKRLQADVDQSLAALTAQAGREPGRLAELAERGFGLLQATGEGLRFDEDQNKTVRGRFGRSLAEAALRAMAPKQALVALESGAIAALLPDAAVRESLRSELTAAETNKRRALKAETAGLMSLHLASLEKGEPGVPDIQRDVAFDFGAEEAKAFSEQAEAARQRHRLRRQWRMAPESEIAEGLEQADAAGDPEAARTVADETRQARRRDPAAVVAEDPKLQALLAAAEEDPTQRELTTGVGLELQKELGIPEGDRRVLTRQGLADLTAQIEAAPPAQRAALLQQIKETYGMHYDRVLSELEGARLDPTTLALARWLDDPVAVQRLIALQGKTRAALSEGLDSAEAEAVAVAARAAVPGPLAPVSERLALARYQQTGDRDDAVALALETVGEGALAGEDDLANAQSGDGITFGPEYVEDGGDPIGLTPIERFEVQGPDGTAFTVTRTEDGDLVFDNPVTGRTGALPKTLVTMVEMASAGDPVMRDLTMRMAILSSLAEGLPDDGSGTRKAVQAASRERFHALVEEALGPIDGSNRMVVVNLHAAFEQSLRARNAADRQRAIEREAFPAFHDAKVKARTDELAGFLTETLIAVTPVVSEVEAGYRAYRALNDYEAAIEAGDQEAAGRHLLEFGAALTEAVPLGGRFAKGTRFAPALDKAKARIGERVAELAGSGRREKASRTLASGDPLQGDDPLRVSALDDDDLESLPRNTTRTLLNQGRQPTCGPTCLGMLLRDRGMAIDLDRLAKEAGTVFAEGVAGGTPVLNMVKTLRRNGIVDARSKRFTTIEQLAQGTKGGHPAIAVIQVRRANEPLPHAVVVDGITIREGKPVVSIRDPANGEASHVPVEQFERRMRKFGRIVIFTNPHQGPIK